ncbi:MAG: PfkB family carbohydrate kinase [Pseudomonadota bacterium]
MVEVLVCGSALVDMVFEVADFPDRAEKYAASAARIVGGGCAGNAAVAITRLGGRARLLARCGPDLMGDLAMDELSREGVCLDLVQRDDGAQSAYSSILVDAAGERQIVSFRGAGLAVLPPQNLGAPQAVLADTRWPEAAEAVFALARAQGVPAVLDGEAPVPETLVALATHTVFSAQGLRDFTGEDDLAAGLHRASTRSDWVAVTDGAAGVRVMNRGNAFHVAAPRIEVTDTLGAGDIWHGAFALALAEGRDEAHALRFAQAAAALKCMRSGGRAGAPDRTETTDFMQRMSI